MMYTVWAHGRKIGETRLELRPSARRRAGAFYPTQFGLGVLPTLATGSGAGARTLEVRDGGGAPVPFKALSIADLEQMRAAAQARQPRVSEAHAEYRDPIKFIISLAVADGRDDPSGSSAPLPC